MTINLSEVSDFLEVAASKHYFNSNTIQSRRLAFNTFSEILDPDQRTVEYLRDNLDLVKQRYMHAHPEMRGSSVDQYGRRVSIVLKDFLGWKTDRSAWERGLLERQQQRADGGEGEKRARPAKAAKAEPAPQPAHDPSVRVVKIPLPARNFEATVTLPQDPTLADIKRIAWGLLAYATDWDPNESPRQTFPQLEDSDLRMGQ